MGVRGYVLSCLVLNVPAPHGACLWGHLPSTKNLLLWLSGVRVCADLGPKEEAEWADRW
jgi:hypothetical protein